MCSEVSKYCYYCHYRRFRCCSFVHERVMLSCSSFDHLPISPTYTSGPRHMARHCVACARPKVAPFDRDDMREGCVTNIWKFCPGLSAALQTEAITSQKNARQSHPLTSSRSWQYYSVIHIVDNDYMIASYEYAQMN